MNANPPKSGNTPASSEPPHPSPADEAALDEALDETYPASDPIAPRHVD